MLFLGSIALCACCFQITNFCSGLDLTGALAFTFLFEICRLSN